MRRASGRRASAPPTLLLPQRTHSPKPHKRATNTSICRELYVVSPQTGKSLRRIGKHCMTANGMLDNTALARLQRVDATPRRQPKARAGHKPVRKPHRRLVTLGWDLCFRRSVQAPRVLALLSRPLIPRCKFAPRRPQSSDKSAHARKAVGPTTSRHTSRGEAISPPCSSK